jgi:hypothetical protein
MLLRGWFLALRTINLVRRVTYLYLSIYYCCIASDHKSMYTHYQDTKNINIVLLSYISPCAAIHLDLLPAAKHWYWYYCIAKETQVFSARNSTRYKKKRLITGYQINLVNNDSDIFHNTSYFHNTNNFPRIKNIFLTTDDVLRRILAQHQRSLTSNEPRFRFCN